MAWTVCDVRQYFFPHDPGKSVGPIVVKIDRGVDLHLGYIIFHTCLVVKVWPIRLQVFHTMI